MRIKTGMGQYPDLLEPRQCNGGKTQQKGQTGGILALEAQKQGRGQCGAGARYTGDQSPHLRQTDQHQIAIAERGQIPVMPTVQLGKAHQHRHQHTRSPNDRQRPQGGVAGIQPFRHQKPDNADGQSGKPDAKHKAEGGMIKLAFERGLHGGHSQTGNIAPEKTHHRRQSGQLHGSRKGGTGILPAKQMRHDPHMGC